MNLKTSLFDKSIIKSDFKRFWWVTAVFMMLLALFVLPNAVKNYAYPEAFADSFYFHTDEGFFSFIFAIGLGGMLFSYLHKGNSASCLHGLPVKRKTQYLSHIFAGVVLLIIPIIISSIVIFIESLCLNSGEMFALKLALKYFYTCGVYAVTTLLVTVFAAMLSGNTIAAYVFTGGFIVLPFAIETISKYVLESNLYGFTPSNYTAISEKLYIYGIDKMCSPKSFVYICMIVILFFVNMWLYKIRSIESYEEIISFKALRPVFMYVVAVFFGFFGWTMLNSMFEFNNIFLGTMPLGIVALIAAFMLNRKSFGIKGLFKPLIIFVVGVGILQLCFVLDITGYERRVPDISQVESVEPYNDVYVYGGYDSYTTDGEIYYSDIGYKGILSEEKDIDNILKLHKAIVDNRNLDKSDFDGTRITIKYNLSNGKTLERSYTINDNLYTDYLKNYYENDVYKKSAYPILNDNNKKINYVTYYGLDTGDGIRLQYIDYDKLMEELEKDISALTYYDIKRNNIKGRGRLLSIDYDEIVDYNGKELKFNKGLDVNITSEFKNTNEFLKDYLAQHKELLINPDNISSLLITACDNAYDKEEAETKDISVDNKNDIIDTYNWIMSLYNETDNYENSITLDISIFVGENQITYGCIYVSEDNIPEVLMKYLK